MNEPTTAAAPVQPVQADAVDVWRIGLDPPPADPARLVSLLSRDERCRAAGFRQTRDRDRFVRSHAAVRMILARYAAVAPDRLVIDATPGAKPRLDGARRVHFNVAHAEDLALCAVAAAREVGVDVERIGGEIGALALAERFFSAAEVSALRALPPHARDAAFVRAWTRKEAYVKARGAGLALPLDDFSVPLDDHTSIVIETAASGPWSVVPLAVGGGYAAAVAVAGRDALVTCRDFAFA